MLEDFTGEVGAEFVKLVWSDAGMQDGMNNGSERLQRNIMQILERSAPDVENWMKLNAPWNDQTGNARNGLAARAFKERDSLGIVLYHQVPYGIFLETKFSGRDAVVGPAVEYWSPRVMERLKGTMEK